MAEALSAAPTSAPSIRRVELDRPWRWLAAGWEDLKAAPGVSLAYGVVFALGGMAITLGFWAAGLLYLALPMAMGFMLVGPLAATGLYEVSRRRAAGEPVELRDALFAFRRNGTQLALMGVALLLFLFAWVRLAALIFMLFFGLRPPALEDLVMTAFFSPGSLLFLIVGTGTGAVLAACVFAIAAVSVPLLLDRPESNVIDAIITSMRAVRANLPAMALWAALVVVFTGAGLATFFIGVAITLPLVGHATWHAYKDLVQHDEHI
jgi:uncharacterized membrane protein